MLTLFQRRTDLYIHNHKENYKLIVQTLIICYSNLFSFKEYKEKKCWLNTGENICSLKFVVNSLTL